MKLCAAPDVEAIIRRLVEAERENDKRSHQYTYVEETERFIVDKNGQAPAEPRRKLTT